MKNGNRKTYSIDVVVTGTFYKGPEVAFFIFVLTLFVLVFVVFKYCFVTDLLQI